MRFFASKSVEENGGYPDHNSHENGNGNDTNDIDNEAGNASNPFNRNYNRIQTAITTVGGKIFNNAVVPTSTATTKKIASVMPVPAPRSIIDGVAIASTQVQPVLVRKTPKFPSRERHMAIRRKKTPSLAPLPWIVPTYDDDSSSTCCTCENKRANGRKTWANGNNGVGCGDRGGGDGTAGATRRELPPSHM